MAVREPEVGIKRVSHWIGGRVVVGNSGRSGAVWNPATGQKQATVDFASAEEVDRAIAVAKEAFKSWRQTPLSRRAEIMFKFRELIDANRKKIAELITLEH
ncbi:MAG: aldehyde dehydrogenase family protein, partial [Meiothermus silvanus]|nr:aldehyde dehydrogenase family protein [Allomeiothermus silvanus]